MSFNNFRDNLPVGFGGAEDDEEETFLFYVQGEPAIEHFTEEEAEEELLDMSLRELVSRGFLSIE